MRLAALIGSIMMIVLLVCCCSSGSRVVPAVSMETVPAAAPVAAAVEPQPEPVTAAVQETGEEVTDDDDGGPADTSRRRKMVFTVNRDRRWAVPMEKPGLPNLHRITDNLYRGAQPTAEGMQQLKAMGIRTVVNLRSFHSDRDEIGGTGLAYEHIYMKAWHPEDKELVRFLQIVTDPARQPVFFHCQHGADRTGTMCALYRMAIQGWTREEALKEMTEGGFGFHGIWQNLIEYINALDIEAVKKRAGIQE